MDDSAQTKLRVAARLDALPEIVAGVEAFGEERELAMGDVFAITLAVEELFANTVNYSQPPASWVELELVADAAGVHVTYRDDAPGSFDPNVAAGAGYNAAGGVAAGGWAGNSCDPEDDEGVPVCP